MKTLDEVIKTFESGYLITDKTKNEALHYLKEYKNTDENYKKAIAHVTEVIDHYEKMVADYLAVNNPPLTWDELKGMEGKPVWMECEYFFRPQWVILTDVYDEKAMFIGDRIVDSELKEEMGNIWQAFRKER